MNKKVFVLLVVVLVLAIAVPVSASSTPTLIAEFDWSFVTVDSKVGGGYWAYDYIDAQASVWDYGGGSYKVVITHQGTFQSWGSDSPGGSGTIEANVTGSIVGGMVLWFQGADLQDVTGSLGHFDFQCDQDGVCSEYVSWRDLIFEDWDAPSYESWAWTYATCDDRIWVNSAAGNEGDITGGPATCKDAGSGAPAVEYTHLVDMYVYYSETGFFGPEDTCVIYVHQGLNSAPAMEIVETVCKQIPEDMVLACSAPLLDDGSNWGVWGCDDFMDSVGQRRLFLRNDPLGEEYSLYNRIMKYSSWLQEEGMID